MAGVDEQRCSSHPLPSADEETDRKVNFGERLHRTSASCLFTSNCGPCPIAIHLNMIVWRVWLKKHVLANGHYRLWIMDNSLDDKVVKGSHYHSW